MRLGEMRFWNKVLASDEKAKEIRCMDGYREERLKGSITQIKKKVNANGNRNLF